MNTPESDRYERLDAEGEKLWREFNRAQTMRRIFPFVVIGLCAFVLIGLLVVSGQGKE